MKYRLRNNFTTNPEQALKEILKNRGVTDIENFIHPSHSCELNPYDLNNIEKAADMLLYHARKNSKILWLVDCDMDGLSSFSILWLYIKQLFPQLEMSFTIHEHKQHGLADKIDWIEQQENIDLIIIPDAGSFDVNEHQRLNDIGIDCLVLDHHQQLYDENGLPVVSTAPRTIIVNNQLSDHYQNKALCGAGIVYKFCEVLDDKLGIQQASTYLDLVALGEIADVMDRTDTETNYLMMEGLKHINNKGFQTLLEAQSYSLKEKAVYPYTGLTPIDVAFYIAPLINAIMRVGSMTEKEVMCYCFIDPQRKVPSTKRGARAEDTETAAEQTARVGKNAKARQDKLKEKALDIIDFKIQKEQLYDNNILIVEIEPEDNIPQEIGGLVAMAVVSKYNKPCLIVRRNEDGLLQGSARTNNNFKELNNFKSYLEQSGYFDYVAGHEGAFGLGIDAQQVDNFINYANDDLSAEDFENCYTVDYILDARKNNTELLYSLAEHPEYFGNHIDEIKVVIKNISLQNVQLMGANKDSVKISFKNIDYVKFKDIDFIEEITNHRLNNLTVLARLNINTFAGHTNLQCFIEDYELINDDHRYDF